MGLDSPELVPLDFLGSRLSPVAILDNSIDNVRFLLVDVDSDPANPACWQSTAEAGAGLSALLVFFNTNFSSEENTTALPSNPHTLFPLLLSKKKKKHTTTNNTTPTTTRTR